MNHLSIYEQNVESFQTAVTGAPLDRDWKQEKTRLPIAVSKMKKLMQQDEIVKMIATETPILFSKAVEVFYTDVVTQAWNVAQRSGRTTIVSADVKEACANCDWLEIFADLINPTEPYVYDTEPQTTMSFAPPAAMLPALEQYSVVVTPPDYFAPIPQPQYAPVPQIDTSLPLPPLPEEPFPTAPVSVTPALPDSSSSSQHLLLPSSKPVEFSALLCGESSAPFLTFDDSKSGPCEDFDFKSGPEEDADLSTTSCIPSSSSSSFEVEFKSMPEEEEKQSPQADSEFYLPSPKTPGSSVQQPDFAMLDSVWHLGAEHVKDADAVFRPHSPLRGAKDAPIVSSPNLQRKRKRYTQLNVSSHDTRRAQTFLSLQGPRRVVEP